MHKEHLYHGNTTENHGNITEIPRKITENHGKSRKITEGFFQANHGNSRIPEVHVYWCPILTPHALDASHPSSRKPLQLEACCVTSVVSLAAKGVQRPASL